MYGHDIIVVGTSAGGVEALRQLVRYLPPGLPASLFVVCHIPPEGRSVLPEILSKNGPLLATHARDGEAIRPGHIFVAPPDYHLVVQPGRVHLSHGPRESHLRPAIDPLFRSAARAYGSRVGGVILTGALHDGVAGLLAVRAAGGAALVQDPDEALSPTMPRMALELVGAAGAGFTALPSHFTITSAICRLFFSSIIMWPLPWMPAAPRLIQVG